ncbi:peroxidase family protein [Umezawaea beigongshangensis]|uniref:peroxidase family protein n=1 Tax=Umezawaea beigongshangensis TaxID=2780383 RepID=UPI0018F1C4B4|nr:heme peroxidase family protein [Umezawaea beigongshangensis]
MALSRVLRDLAHGGHAVDDGTPEAAELVQTQEGISALKSVAEESDPDTTPFGYLFPDLARRYPRRHLSDDNPAEMVAYLKALGFAMAEEAPASPFDLQPDGNSTIPPVYTYWGQFIDHDLTANTDRDADISITDGDPDPIRPNEVLERLRNLRQPALNLDSLYGDGPTFGDGEPTEAAAFYDGAEFVIGTAAVNDLGGNPIPGLRVPPEGDLRRDLPRDETGTALVADDRDDENLIVAQLHVAFLRFHNAVVAQVRADEPELTTPEEVFFRARDLVRWHYQWLVVHDFLKTVTADGVTDEVLETDDPLYRPRGEAFMPLEHSTAAFRFGHTLVRGSYDFNLNFGRAAEGQNPLLPSATFDLLFTFTGKADPPLAGQATSLPHNWIIDWNRFVDKADPLPDRFARKIDTQLAPPLRELLNEGRSEEITELVRGVVKRLARRNLLRGYKLGLPTGQAVARRLQVPVLTPEQLLQGTGVELRTALVDGGFLDETPLWFYLLKEAEVLGEGNALGPVGSRIVNETIIGQLRHDPESYLNQPGWSPEQGVRLPDGGEISTIGDLLRFAGVR